MKRPQKVTRETRPNRYARRMYGKEKTEKIMDEEDMERISTSKAGTKKKIRTVLNRKLRHSMKNRDLPDGAAYRREISWEDNNTYSGPGMGPHFL